MVCPKCGTKLYGNRRRCPGCGADVSALEGLKKLSNRYYNEGLECAEAKNLTGAINALKLSLDYNKENIDARNLLGLVYFEIGETVQAIVEWVISSNILKQDNLATELLEKVQADGEAFRADTAAIQKYNQALDMLNNGNADLALIQLKKVVKDNERFQKGYLLMALIYIQNCEYEKARKILKTVLKKDVGCVTARRYMVEIKHILAIDNPKGQNEFSVDDDIESSFTPERNARIYTDDNRPNFAAFGLFFVGILVGVLVIYFLAVPQIEASIMQKYNDKAIEIGNQVTSDNDTLNELREKIETLQNTITDLESQLLVADTKSTKAFMDYLALCVEFNELYRDVIIPAEESVAAANAVAEASGSTQRFMVQFNEAHKLRLENAVSSLKAVDMKVIDNENAIKTYEFMKEILAKYLRVN